MLFAEPCTTLQVKGNIIEIVFKRVCNDRIMPCTFPISPFLLGQIALGFWRKSVIVSSSISLTTNFLLKSICELSKRVPESGWDPYCAKGLLYRMHATTAQTIVYTSMVQMRGGRMHRYKSPLSKTLVLKKGVGVFSMGGLYPGFMALPSYIFTLIPGQYWLWYIPLRLRHSGMYQSGLPSHLFVLGQ